MPTSSSSSVRAAKCAACESGDLHYFFEQRNVPAVCNQLLTSPSQAKAAKLGDISLAFCGNCGIIANLSFDSKMIDYNASYENALHYSEKFREFATKLASGLVERHGLAGKRVAEIGCGDGYFLELLLQNGVGSGVGYDPSMADGRRDAVSRHGALQILPVLFDDQNIPDDVELVVCRHVLEHIPDPISFLSSIRRTIGNRTCSIYFEVPNAQWMLESGSIWDVIYEHVTYWTAQSLTHALQRAGFSPTHVQTGFSDQYLMVEARPADTGAPTSSNDRLSEIKQLAITFGAFADRTIGDWQSRLTDLRDRGASAVLWGAGSKGVTFLNVVPAASEVVSRVVDVNSRKHGMFIAGTSHAIVAPIQIVEAPPEVIIVANSFYLDEIRTMTNKMGLTPDLATIAG